ncbi:MAG: thioredoxin family protein [Armatimonadota bacterium]|nr:thioredoxin family protein [Armatimonadota bacterium]MDR7438457.1 thioredoxin family protein [Armatimonadota bacterium]MDR7563154.1 thioredoxin family protein [Armatimonadota bacterium]MDR7567145.1 thioredoxin family protein [Armatimonadota bacterium]MDR7602183.1 thioredoxin family protein [Armatimonadota bacterium]
MPERALIVLGIFLLVAVGWSVLLHIHDRRFLRAQADVPGPAVVAFTHPLCVPCRTQQMPALERLQTLNPEVRIEVVDVQRQPERARRYGIWTVPATAVVDASGRIAALNHGVTDEHRLLGQLARSPSPRRDPVRA